ncbi:MAG: chromate transporter [candidate division WOR-3 bacterium]
MRQTPRCETAWTESSNRHVTPGPVASTATSVGYRVLGIAGALLATLGMFLPSFVILLVMLVVYDRVRNQRLVQGFIQGVTSAAVGTLLAAAILVGRDAVTTIPSAGVALGSLVVLLLGRVNPAWLVAGGALTGLLLRPWLHP